MFAIANSKAGAKLEPGLRTNPLGRVVECVRRRKTSWRSNYDCGSSGAVVYKNCAAPAETRRRKGHVTSLATVTLMWLELVYYFGTLASPPVSGHSCNKVVCNDVPA